MDEGNALTEFLERQIYDRIGISLDEIEDEDKIGMKLPRAAREDSEWWINENNPQCRAWLAAGWRVEQVDRSGEIVVFVRVRNRK